jgi:hypothetical protein
VPFYCAHDYEKMRSVYGAVLSKFTVKIRIAESIDLGSFFKFIMMYITSWTSFFFNKKLLEHSIGILYKIYIIIKFSLDNKLILNKILKWKAVVQYWSITH